LTLPGVDAGAEEAARLLGPEPHIPDIPDVSIIGEVVGTSEELGVAPVAGAVVVGAPATDIPPPS